MQTRAPAFRAPPTRNSIHAPRAAARSLYPSLYRAYNLCYTTLVHPEDLDAIGRGSCTVTPANAAFVKPEVRAGVLPGILAALMTAR